MALVEGNKVFQVVWLPEEEREQILQVVRQRVEDQLPAAAGRLPLVFEGNTPAELERKSAPAAAVSNRPQPNRLHGPSWARAWLGEAIAIKDPTAAVFRRQTGDNLLIVGQNDEAALALLTAALVSLAVQQPAAQFLVLDGTADHQPHFGYLKEVIAGWPQAPALVERAALATALVGWRRR